MKITKRQLKQIIKEELGKALKEGPTEPGVVDFNAMRTKEPERYAQIETDCETMHPDDPRLVFRCMSYKATGLKYPPQEG